MCEVFDFATLREEHPDRSFNPHAATVHALHGTGLDFSPFARRYLGNHACFLFLQVLRWFSSLGVPSIPYVFRYG